MNCGVSVFVGMLFLERVSCKFLVQAELGNHLSTRSSVLLEDQITNNVSRNVYSCLDGSRCRNASQSGFSDMVCTILQHLGKPCRFFRLHLGLSGKTFRRTVLIQFTLEPEIARVRMGTVFVGFRIYHVHPFPYS